MRTLFKILIAVFAVLIIVFAAFGAIFVLDLAAYRSHRFRNINADGYLNG